MNHGKALFLQEIDTSHLLFKTAKLFYLRFLKLICAISKTSYLQSNDDVKIECYLSIK